MGEIADGMIDGTFDSISGEYLGEGSGYPRSNDPDFSYHKSLKDSTIRNQVSGVKKWLYSRGLKKKTDYYLCALTYARSINPAIDKNTGMKKIVEIFIEPDFRAFTKWVINHYLDERT